MNLPLNTLANTHDPVAQARYNMIEQQIRPWNVLDQDVRRVRWEGEGDAVFENLTGCDQCVGHKLGDGVSILRDVRVVRLRCG